MEKKNRRSFLKKFCKGLTGLGIGILTACGKSPVDTGKPSSSAEETVDPPKPNIQSDYGFKPCSWDKFLKDVQDMPEQEAKDFIIRIVDRVFAGKDIPPEIKKELLKVVCDSWGSCAGFPFACPCTPA